MPQKLLYLGGKRAPGEHRDWIAGVLGGDERRAGLMLAAPNAVILSIVAILSLFTGDGVFAGFLIGAALVVLLVGFGVPAVSRRRAERIAAKNGLQMPS